MKLDSVKVFVVGNPPPSYGGRYFVFLKLKTACGIEGRGRGIRGDVRSQDHRAR